MNNENVNSDEKVVEVKDFKDLEDNDEKEIEKEEVVHPSLTEAISDTRQRDFYRSMQNNEDLKVFAGVDGGNINRPGFDDILSFEAGIEDLTIEINEYKVLLNEYQNEINALNERIDRISLHPEDDFSNQAEFLRNKKVSVRDRAVRLRDKIKREERNLMVLEAARKDFIKNKQTTYKTKQKLSLHDEYLYKERELKALEAKIYMGTANNFDKERFEILKNEVLPGIEKKIIGENIKPVIERNPDAIVSKPIKANVSQEVSSEVQENAPVNEEKSLEEKANEASSEVQESAPVNEEKPLEEKANEVSSEVQENASVNEENNNIDKKTVIENSNPSVEKTDNENLSEIGERMIGENIAVAKSAMANILEDAKETDQEHIVNGFTISQGRNLSDNNTFEGSPASLIRCNTEPEERKKVSLISRASEWIKSKIFGISKDTIVVENPVSDENRLTEEQINNLAGQVNAPVVEVNNEVNSQVDTNSNNMVNQVDDNSNNFNKNVNNNYIPDVNTGNSRTI
ncbi:MAG: hypothetical protein Q4C29_03565 [bacterium]|nr:hypothetical protein [bacterium]